MRDLLWDEIGFPAQSTPVRKDKSVLFAPPLKAEDREHERQRALRYRARIRKAKSRTRAELRNLGVGL